MMSMRNGACFWIVAMTLVGSSAARGDGYPHAAGAKREYAAVFAHSDRPCPWTDNVSYLRCMGKEIEFTEAHLDAFVSDMRAIASASERANQPNPGSPRALDEFNKTDKAWREYRESACNLQRAWFGRGTGGSPAAAECELSLDREYMKRLAGFFNLHELA